MKDLIINEELANNMSKEELVKQIEVLSNTRRKKFLRRKEIKYRTPGAKAFTPETFTAFINAHKPDEWRFRVMWLVDATLGLRISELLDLKKSDFDFQRKTVCIHTLKQKAGFVVNDYRALNPMLEQLIEAYLINYAPEVDAHSGFMFFSKCHGTNLSTAYCRRIFRAVCDRAGLNQHYAERESLNGLPLEKQNKGKLYFLSPHSIRHCYGRYVADLFKPTIAMGLLRLNSWDVFNTYTSANFQDLHNAGMESFHRNEKVV
jgi:integrase